MRNWLAFRKLKKNPWLEEGCVLKKIIGLTKKPHILIKFTSSYIELENVFNGDIIILDAKQFLRYIPVFLNIDSVGEKPDASRELSIVPKTDSISSVSGDPFTEVLPGSDKRH